MLLRDRSHLSHVAAAIVVVTLVAGPCAAVRADELPVAPQTPSSHAVYLELLDGTRDEFAERVLRAYDDRLRQAPDDVVAAAERAQWLEMAFYDEMEEYNRYQDRADSAFAELDRRHGMDPYAITVLLEQQWGDAAEEFYEERVAGDLARFDKELRVRIAEHLASTLSYSDPSRAGTHAVEALELGGGEGLEAIAAQSLLDSGQRERAHDWLMTGVSRAESPWQKQRLAEILSDGGWSEHALSVLEEVRSAEFAYFDRQRYAKALVAAGRFDAAREAYRSIDYDQEPNAQQILRERFQFELEHGSAATALEAYDALLGGDPMVDPLLRDRLDLYLHHRDSGLGSISWVAISLSLLLVVGICLLPLVVLGPLHHLSMWRHYRGRALAMDRTRWGLRHVWLLTAAYLLVFFGSIYLFLSAEFAQMLSESGDAEFTIPDHALIPSLWLQLAITVVMVVLLSLRRNVVRMFRTCWSKRQLLVRCLVMTFWVRLAAGILSLFGRLGAEPAAIQRRMLLELENEHGVLVLVLVVVVAIPLFEEFLFRGVVLDGLRRHFGMRWANAGQALGFALIHDSLLLSPMFFAFGLVAGRLRARSGGLIAPVVFHMMFNAVATLSLLIWS